MKTKKEIANNSFQKNIFNAKSKWNEMSWAKPNNSTESYSNAKVIKHTHTQTEKKTPKKRTNERERDRQRQLYCTNKQYDIDED